MKLDIIKTIAAIMVGALGTYSLTLCNGFLDTPLYPIACFILFSAILVMALSVNIEGMRTMLNVRITSWLFFIVIFVANLLLRKCHTEIPAFIITNGVISVTYLALVSSLIKATKK